MAMEEYRHDNHDLAWGVSGGIYGGVLANSAHLFSIEQSTLHDFSSKFVANQIINSIKFNFRSYLLHHSLFTVQNFLSTKKNGQTDGQTY